MDNPENVNTPGGRIASIIDRRGLTQRGAATELGVSQPALNRVVNDQQRPDIELLRTLAERWGVSPSWVILGREINLPNEEESEEYESALSWSEVRRVADALERLTPGQRLVVDLTLTLLQEVPEVEERLRGYIEAHLGPPLTQRRAQAG